MPTIEIRETRTVTVTNTVRRNIDWKPSKYLVTVIDECEDNDGLDVVLFETNSYELALWCAKKRSGECRYSMYRVLSRRNDCAWEVLFTVKNGKCIKTC